MANKTGGTDTVCPFYVREADKSITCEGLVIGTLTQHRFTSIAEMLSYQARYCSTQTYNRCPHAASLAKKYANVGNTDIFDGNTDITFPTCTTIGQRIAITRRRVGFTQEALSHTAHISRSYIADIEADRYKPSIDTLKALSTALGVDAKHFITEANHEK